MKKLLAFISLLTLAGCATPYAANGLLGGFSETQLGDDLWQISFEGNGYTSKKTTIDYTMLRSAELTLQQGYAYFVVVDKNAFSNGGAVLSNTTTNFNGSAFRAGNTVYGSGRASSFGMATVIQYPTANQTIMMLKEKPEGVLAYNAEMICRSLGAHYKVTCQTLKPAAKKGQHKKQ